MAETNERRADDAREDGLSAALSAQQTEQRITQQDIERQQIDTTMEGHPASLHDMGEDEVVVEPAPAEPTPGEPAPPVEPAHRFQSWDEAEAAHAESERRITEEAQRREWLEHRLDQMEADNRAFRDTLLQQRQEPEPEPEPPTPRPAFNAREHWANVYSRLEQLDPDAENYEQQRLDIIAEAQSTVDNHYTTLIEEERQAMRQEVQSLREETTRLVSQQNEVRDLVRKGDKLRQMAMEAGLDISDPTPENPYGGMHLRDLQFAVDQQLYPADADEDTAMRAVIEGVAARHGITGRPHPTSTQEPQPNGVDEDARRVQAMNQPMERNGVGRPANSASPPAEETQPASLDEVVRRINAPLVLRR